MFTAVGIVERRDHVEYKKGEGHKGEWDVAEEITMDAIGGF